MDVGFASIVLWMSANFDCSVGVLSIVLADVGVASTVVVLSVVEEVLKECWRLVDRPSGCWRHVDSSSTLNSRRSIQRMLASCQSS